MDLLLLVPLGAAAAAAMLAGYAWARRGRHRAHGAVAELSCAVLFWATCQVLWNATDDPELALRLVRLSAFGWLSVGPLLLRVFLATGRPSRWSRAVPGLLAVAWAFAAIDFATAWMHPSVVPAPWGWAYTVGPLFFPAVAFTLGCIALGLVRAIASLRRAGSPAERSQLRAFVAGYLVPVCVASFTDGVLPALGVLAPPLGTASFVGTGAVVVWTVRRFGYSLVAPHALAEEVLDALRDGVALLHPDGTLRHANAAFAALVGRPAEALIGRPVARWLPALAPAPTAEGHHRETELVASHGGTVPVTVTTHGLRDKLGQPLGLVLGVRDLREVVALRRRVVTQGRLAAVGELAAGIAHEINNPLAYLRSNLGVLRSLLEELDDAKDGTPPGLEDGRELVEESVEGVDRIAAVVRDLRTLSGPSSGARELVDVNALLEAALRVVQPALRFGARVERRLAEVPHVAGCAAELQHVFLAVLLRAGRALRGQGTVEIASGALDGEVVVRVRDDGCGIPAGLQERVFDPFFRFGEPGVGGGLELAVAWQVVQQHGGSIALDSSEEGGTEVEIRLPAAP